MQPLVIEIWSDIACPWCFIGKRRFEAALQRTPEAGPVSVTWRAFELDPRAPKRYPDSPGHNERLARKYGVSLEEAERMVLRVVNLGKPEGIEFDFDAVKGGNTFDAHRLLAFAKASGAQHALKERLLRAYFCEGAQISDPSALSGFAADAGLDVDAVSSVLASDQHAADVRRDEATAAELGIRGVPFFKIGRYGVSGAQPADLLVEVIAKARAELDASEPMSASPKEASAAGEVCDVERGC
ncbi:MAG TPA: DsbA family oxidoreductase [Polyangiaceae bacterium]|nr:DsbA family oxidoreductase [Polyangiaceae bacterium]